MDTFSNVNVDILNHNDTYIVWILPDGALSFNELINILNCRELGTIWFVWIHLTHAVPVLLLYRKKKKNKLKKIHDICKIIHVMMLCYDMLCYVILVNSSTRFPPSAWQNSYSFLIFSGPYENMKNIHFLLTNQIGYIFTC